MGSRQKFDFRSEAERRFSFLVQELGFEPPIYDEFILPTLLYQGRRVGYQIGFDRIDKVVSVVVLKERQGSEEPYRVNIEKVVLRSGLGGVHDVHSNGRTPENMAASLENLASWVRRLHHVLIGLEGDELLRSPTWPPR